MDHTVRKTFKYKLHPTPQQQLQFETVLWRCRVLYNTALEQRITAWQRCQITLSQYQQDAELKDIRAEFPEYAAIHSHILKDVLARLDKTYQAFFRRMRHGEKAGFPRFKGRNHYHSFTFIEYGRGARLDNGYLVLSKIGRIAVRWSRPIEGTIKTVTISREADGWYACFSCADVPTQPLPLTGHETGVDLGVESFATLADGSKIANPRIFRVAELNLKRAQRRVSRRKKGSNRRKKAVVLLAKAHQRVRRARADFHHKTALALVRQYDTICHEALQTANLVRRPKPQPDGNGRYLHNGAGYKVGLNKAIKDAGWSQFLQILAFKAECAGKRVEAVPPAFTSQACSGCGVLVQKDISVRWHECPECGTSLHRDHNAALNILQRGRERSAVGQAVQVPTQPIGAYVA